MRIVCPNCEAEYEVPEEAIPTSGREVQCSVCGKAWFQRPAGDPIEALAKIKDLTTAKPDGGDEASSAPAEATPEPAAASQPASAPVSPPPAPPPPRDPAPAPAAAAPEAPAAPPQPAPAPQPTPADITATPPAPEVPPRQPIDAGVAAILRSEAERESALREQERKAAAEAAIAQADAVGPEGAEPIAQPQHPQRVRVTRRDTPRRGASRPAPNAMEEVTAEMDKRKDLLPNIDDVTRKLGKQGEAEIAEAAAAKPQEAHEAPAPQQRGSAAFTRGFALALLIAVVAWLVYFEADTVADQIPQAEPYLQGYVQGVNDARVWIDAQVGNFIPR